MLKTLLVVAALALSAITGWIIFAGFPAMAWLSLMATGFVVSKLLLTNMMSMGHGVNGSRHVLGMTIFLFGAYLVILVAILVLAVPVASFDPGTNANLKVLGFALFYGWVAGLIDWYAESSRLTHYHTEYGFRVAMKANGYSKERTEKEIDQLRKEGLLAPLTKEEEMVRQKKQT